MLRSSLGLVGVLCLVLASNASAGPHSFYTNLTEIRWQPDLATARAQAEKLDRPLLVFIYGRQCGFCKKLAASTLKDAKIDKAVNRHFVAVSLEDVNLPQEIVAHTNKLPRQVIPSILYLDSKGQFLSGTTGFREKDEMLEDLQKAQQKLPPASPDDELDIARQLRLLAKALEAKKYASAGTAFGLILKTKGYSAKRDKAYDLIDAAQEDAVKKIAEAVGYAAGGKYETATATLNEVLEEYAGLPVAQDAGDELAAVKLVRAADEAAEEGKKERALSLLAEVQTSFAESAAAALARKRKAKLDSAK